MSSFIILLFILAVIVPASLLSLNKSWHFVSIVDLSIIFIATVTAQPLGRNNLLQSIRFLFILGLMFGVFPSTTFIRNTIGRPSIEQSMKSAVDDMMRGIEDARKLYGPFWPQHVSIATYDDAVIYDRGADIFWYLLEARTHTVLTENSFNALNSLNLKPIGDSSYMIVVCVGYGTVIKAEEHCIPRFRKSYPSFTKLNLFTLKGGYYIVYSAH